jgi:twitching motility two-component system response regulator PilG
MSQEQLNSEVDGTETTTNAKKMRILVVDDSATIRRSAETMLSNESCEVITAENGFESLSKITRHLPNLIFVDIMMPRLDGYQTCAIIKNNAEFRDTPVVMLTSKDGLFDMARGRVVGSDQYLTKPFTREELLGAVKQHTTS